MEYKFEVKNNKYCLIFSDGVILKEKIKDPNALDYNSKYPYVITNFNRPDDRWTYFALLSNGEIEKYEVKCACSLPKEVPAMSPVQYEMYILLFENWVRKGKLIYSEENKFELTEVVKQFDEKQGKWLSDLNTHKFICKQCSDQLIISINTYRGGGGLERQENTNSNNLSWWQKVKKIRGN